MNFKDAIRTLKFKKNNGSYHQLYTSWGEKLDTSHVLQEYPRPQLRRRSYVNLNGYWDYAITKEEIKPTIYEGKILVPFSPESVLSEVNRQLQPGEVLWYERKLKIDKKPLGYRCILHFGALDQFCEVFVNDKKLTEHIGGYLPFNADITKEIHKGENTLRIKVKDESDRSYHSRGKQKLNRGGMFYTAQSGIWQTVWMEWVPGRYIESLRITPLLDESKIRVEIKMNGDNKEGTEVYKMKIFSNGYLIKSVTSRQAIIEMTIDEVKYWSPEEPFLYDCTISSGEDTVESYFAMRKVEIKKDEKGIQRIYLNDQEYFQNGLLDQGYWPDGLYTAPSDQALIFDIEKAKELGFNMLRKHLKIEPLRWYYHCDRLGMLVWQDMVNGGEKYRDFLVGHLPTLFPSFKLKDKNYFLLGRKNEDGRKEWIRECEETVNHLYNHPCLVTWVPFNEGWGQFDAEKIYDLIKSIDQTRLIDHASGWFDQGKGDFKSIHNYFHPLKMKEEKRPVILSEYGGYACYIKEHSYSWQIYGYRIYLTKEDLNKDVQKLISSQIETLKEEGLTAAVYTQLSDVEDEVNGLLTYDRKICKIDPLT